MADPFEAPVRASLFTRHFFVIVFNEEASAKERTHMQQRQSHRVLGVLQHSSSVAQFQNTETVIESVSCSSLKSILASSSQDPLMVRDIIKDAAGADQSLSQTPWSAGDTGAEY